MARFEITSPDGRRFEVTAPDGASQSEVLAFARQQQEVRTHKPVSATDDMSGMDKFWAAMGKGITDVGQGIGQRFGQVSKEEVAESRKRDAPLMDSGAGVAGNIAGNLLTVLPALAVPGANSIAGATAIGALSGAARPTVEGESVAQNVATDAALGGASQWGIGKGAEFFGRRLAAIKEEALAKAARNSVKDTAVAEAGELGYKTIPSVSGGNLSGRILEGLTGKEKAAQLAAVKNQPITEALARKALGVAEDVPLTHETMREVRMKAIAEGYDPVRQIPAMPTDNAFRVQVSKITSRADNASKDFGDLVQSDVKPFVDELHKLKGFSGDSAVDAISVFREKASVAYGQGNKTLGKAYRQAAEAVEDQIERTLAAQGKDGAAVLKDYRAARTRVAQTGDLEKALREGEGTIDARVIGRLYEKAPDRMTGELAQIGKTASAMRDVMGVPKAGWANPVTALDSGFGVTGGLIAGNPLPLAYPAARAAGRFALMSGPGQKMFSRPNYNPGALDSAPPMLLEALKRRGAGGLAGSAYPVEE